MLLSIIDIIKTIGRMGITQSGHQDDSKYHPDVGQPSGHDGLGNFVELVNLTIRQGNTSLEQQLKTCNSRETSQQTFVGLDDVFKTSSRHVWKTFSTRLQRISHLPKRLGRRKIVTLKTSSRHVWKMSWRHVLKTSWRNYRDKQNTCRNTCI